MIEPFISLFHLRWTNQPYYHPLPEHITRTFITTSITGKELELLSAKPSLPSKASSVNPPPILFLHGGFGSAAVFIPFLTYFQSHYPSKHSVYAVSLRGHGTSYSLSYLRHVYGTTISDLSQDLTLTIQHITNLEGQTPIVVAHSSGGGLLQYTLSQPNKTLSSFSSSANSNTNLNLTIPAQVLLSSVQNTGNLPIYLNWAIHDPYFTLRLLIHFFHAASPLSSPNLIKSVFFGSKFQNSDKSQTKTKEFANLMSPYESLTWPIQMMKGFWTFITTFGKKGKWIDASHVIDNGISVPTTLSPSENAKKDQICIILGNEDKLMDLPGQRIMVAEYRNAMRNIRISKDQDYYQSSSFTNHDEKDGDGHGDGDGVKGLRNRHHSQKQLDDSKTQVQTQSINEEEGIYTESAQGVRLVVVEGAGHHIQNDLQWEKAAGAILDFAVQVPT